MSTSSAEATFYDAVAVAAATRQNAKATAATVYGFVQANYAAYLTSLVAADVAYTTAVNTAASSAGIIPRQQAVDGPVPSARWAKIGGL